ncbi:MAG: hypothetical protein SWY16_06390 [Cyanobacteriota bacterium]|nr:hypothetical protein [Cyanobacteriota bacterium]
MKFHQLTLATMTLLTLSLSGGTAFAQTETDTETDTDNSSEVWIPTEGIQLNRAKNFARQAAERANGGLENYRAESSMHGPSSDAPYVVNEDGSWTFTFQGRTPGADTYTIETSVTVSSDAQSVTIDYNREIEE